MEESVWQKSVLESSRQQENKSFKSINQSILEASAPKANQTILAKKKSRHSKVNRTSELSSRQGHIRRIDDKYLF